MGKLQEYDALTGAEANDKNIYRVDKYVSGTEGVSGVYETKRVTEGELKEVLGVSEKTYSTPEEFEGTDLERIELAINEAVTLGYRKVILNGSYLIPKGIDLPSDFELEVNGELKLEQPKSYNLVNDSGLITSLTKTTVSGSYKRTDNRDYELVDATGLVVGQIISFLDDDFPKQFFPHTNRRGLVAKITAINGNTVTLDRDFSNWLTSTPEGSYMALASKNARFVNTDFVLRMDGKNQKLTGSGVLDGNRPFDGGVLDIPNDPNLEPMNDYANEEDFTLGAGSVVNCLGNAEDFIIEGVEIKGGFLHNVRIRGAKRFTVEKTFIHDAHDKNLLLHYCEDGLINNNLIKNALFEDGIIVYIFNRNIRITNNLVKKNPRMGIAIQQYSENCTMSGNVIEYNGQNLYVGTKTGFTSTNDVLVGGRMGTYRTQNKFALNISLLIEGEKITFNGLQMIYPYNKSTITYPEATNWKPIVIRSVMRNNIGQAKGIVFNGGSALNMWCKNRNTTTGDWIGTSFNGTNNIIEFGGASGGDDLNIDGVSFNDFVFDGFGRGFLFRHQNETLLFSSLRFNQCVFKNSNVEHLFENGALQDDIDAVQFINCDNYLVLPYDGGVVTNGQFITDSDWTKGTGWSINTALKQAECDGSQTGITLLAQNGILEIGETYRVKFDCVVSSGTIRIRLGFSGETTPRSVTGSYSEDVVCSGNINLDVSASSDFVGSVTNISAIKIS